MRTSLWKTGLLALLTVAGFGSVNRAEAKPANLDVDFNRGDSRLQCYNGFTVSCFDVTSDKNITHIFVDVDTYACESDPDFFVTVDGEAVEKLHTNGGPCTHDNDNGQIDIDRIVWFPVPQNQSEAEVCVYVEARAPVTVGAKSANECDEASNHVYECEDCRKHCDYD